MVTGLHPDGDDVLSRLIDGLRQAAEQSWSAWESVGIVPHWERLREVA